MGQGSHLLELLVLDLQTDSWNMKITTAEAIYENPSVSRKGRCLICVLELVTVRWAG